MDRVIKESSKRVTAKFNGYPGHKGVDLGWRQDESQNRVFANCEGTVVEVQDGFDRLSGATGTKSWGNYVLVKHPNGMHTRYAHLQKGIKVKKSQSVDENTVLGVIGDSGNVTARHLHFEVQKTVSASTRIDPTPYLTKPVYEEVKKLRMKGHVQDIGWTDWNDKSVGTTGQSKRLEAVMIDAPFDVEAKIHLQDIGWKNLGKITKNTIIGTTGESRRLECLCLKGNFEFRVHIQNEGWSAWTKADGVATLGTVGQALRIEMIEFRQL